MSEETDKKKLNRAKKKTFEAIEKGQFREDKEMTGLTKEIYDMLQEIPDVLERGKILLDVLSHSSDEFNIVFGRMLYETYDAMKLTMTFYEGDKPDEDAVYYSIGRSLNNYSDKMMEKYFPDEREGFRDRAKKIQKKEKNRKDN